MLSQSTSWCLVGTGAGDSGVKAYPYAKVSIYENPKGVDSSQSPVGIFNFELSANDVTTLILMQSRIDQSIYSDTYAKDIAEKAPSTTFWIAKNTDTRLYRGFYYGDGVNAPNKENALLDEDLRINTYSKIDIAFTCPEDIWKQVLKNQQSEGDKRLRAVLSGFRIESGDKYLEIGHNYIDNNGKITNGIYPFQDGKTYKEVIPSGTDLKIYPIWQALTLVTVNVSDRFGVVSANGARALEGDKIIVTSGTVTAGTYNVVSYIDKTQSKPKSTSVKSIKYNDGSRDYLLSGLSSSPLDSGNVALSYNDWTKYGILRILKAQEEYGGFYQLEHRTQTVTNSNNNYSVEIIAGKQDITLYAVWLEYGYTIKYQYNGKVSNATFNVQNKEDYCITETYNHLQGMPIKVGLNFNVSELNNGQLVVRPKHEI